MLTIKDLSASKELDRAAMTAVRGGSSMDDYLNSFNWYDIDNKVTYTPDYSTDILANLQIGNISANNNFGSVVIPQLAQNSNQVAG